MACFSPTFIVAFGMLLISHSICNGSSSMSGSKYSKDVNSKSQDFDIDEESIENQERPFRMKTVNLMWIKARKILSSEKLADLFADLKIQDQKEANLKKIKSENSDEDGLKEAEVLSSYNNILRTYGLMEHFMHEKKYSENEIPYDDEKMKSIQFEDLKLRGMWRRALQAGFSDEDLNILKEELGHQQMKINEFHFMSREIGIVPDLEDNIIDVENGKVKTQLSPTELKEKRIVMKQRNKEIRDGYYKLEHLQSNFKVKEPLLKDTRVRYLWSLAKKTNWSEEELESFKEELQHYEHRLSKRDYYDDQLSLHDESMEGKSEKIKHLEETRKNIHQTVKKIRNDLKMRLEKAIRHTEL